MPDFGDETRRWMTLRGWTQGKTADAARIDRGDFSKMLRGIKFPTPANMASIDTALKAGGTIRDSEPRRPSKTPDGVPRRRLGKPDAAAILATLQAFRGIDNRSGGGHAHALAASYLDKSVTPMLRDGSYSEPDGRLLFAAAAQVAALAAWTAYDTGAAKAAETYFARALELASAAGDSAFTGEVLAARSHRAIHLGNPARAVELARAARHAGTGVALLAAEAWELEANGHALGGDRGACTAALIECEREFGRASDDTPDWLGYFDEAYLAARIAHTLRDLGDWQGALEHAARAETLSGDLARARVFNTLITATAHVQADRDAAVGSGRQALAMTAGMQSRRAAEYTRDLRKRLRRRYGSGDPEVMSFEQECRELLGS